MRFLCELEKDGFLAAATLVRNIEVRESGSALQEALNVLNGDLNGGRAGGSDATRMAVRDLLRNGKYKPAGRGKPAQEYLAKVWRSEGSINLINNAVDVNNIVSLRHGLPISAFDADKLEGDVVIRLGRPGEAYLFNASGQELACQDLVVVCDDRGPVGSPVKDSQATKLFPGAKALLYVVYASAATTSAEELLKVAGELGDLMKADCPEAEVSESVLFEGGYGRRAES